MQARYNSIIIFIVLVALVFVARLFGLQVADDSFIVAARNNAVQRITDYPYRGEIYDREGRLLVKNEAVFDVQVIPREVNPRMDTARFCSLFGISREEFVEKMKAARSYSRVKPSTFISQISLADWQRIQDQFVDFPGFVNTPRTVRSYPAPILGNALGYLAEVGKAQMDRQGPNGYYRQGDYLGISGLEAHYEEYLRGKRGVKYQLVNVHGAPKGPFADGLYDTLSVRGENLYTHVDMDLQAFAESLMVNKAGSLVAIEPATGGILAFVSAPNYDPNLLRGRDFRPNYRALAASPSLPLFNRPLMSMYPPGSIFKLLQALIAQQLGVMDSNTTLGCVQDVVKCHKHPSPNNLKGAVQYSCNPYFLNIFRRIILQGKSNNIFDDSRQGYTQWREYIMRFGLGDRLGVDLPNEKRGILPTYAYFDKVYGTRQWKYSNIRSMSIGQGELGMVPLQMANVAATIANRGFYITPHFARGIGQPGQLPPSLAQRHETGIDPQFFEPIITGMQRAVDRGTVSSKARLPGVEICGKTGTAQNPQGEDHSVFICFAPRQNPKIAMAVFVENAGFGGLVAAPIATLCIEKYLNDTITRPQLLDKIKNMDFLTQNRAYFAAQK